MLLLQTHSCSAATPIIAFALALCFWLVATSTGCDDGAEPGPSSSMCQPLATNGGESSVPAPTLELPPAVGQPFFQGTMFDLAEVGYRLDAGFILAEDAIFIEEAAEALEVWP